MAGRHLDRLRVARGRPVAVAVIRRVEMRAAFEDLAWHAGSCANATRAHAAIELDRGPIGRPACQNARGDKGTGRWGDCRLAHREADITMDVLASEFLPIKCPCRLDRGPIPARAYRAFS